MNEYLVTYGKIRNSTEEPWLRIISINLLLLMAHFKIYIQGPSLPKSLINTIKGENSVKTN